MPKWAWISIVTIILTVSGWSILRFQEMERFQQAQTLEKASDAYCEQDWATSQSLYEQVVKIEPENKLAWYRLGVAYHFEGQPEKARSALLTSMEKGFAKSAVYYNIACSYSMEGKVEEALSALGKAVAEGYDSHKWMANDPDLKPLHSLDRFQKILARSKELRERNSDAHDVNSAVGETE